MKLFCRRTSSVREHFVHFTGIVKEKFDGRILCGEFTKSRKPSDLVEEQEGYGECFSKCKLRRNRAIGSPVDTHFGFRRFEGAEESDNTEWTGGVLVDTRSNFF
jgi:hypothetical protein